MRSKDQNKKRIDLQTQEIILGLKDLNRCFELDKAALDGLWTKKQWEQELSNPSNISLGIIQEKTLIAIATGLIVYDELNINAVGVHPEFRRNGFGSKIVGSLLNHAIKHGSNKAILEVKSSNNCAQSFYQGFGFRLVSCRKRYYKDGSDAMVLITELGPHEKNLFCFE